MEDRDHHATPRTPLLGLPRTVAVIPADAHHICLIPWNAKTESTSAGVLRKNKPTLTMTSPPAVTGTVFDNGRRASEGGAGGGGGAAHARPLTLFYISVFSKKKKLLYE